MKVATLGLVALFGASFAVGAVAGTGPNENGYLLLHTDDAVVYTSDIADYCPEDICADQFNQPCPPSIGRDVCQAYLAAINPTSGLGADVTVFWVIAAFQEDSCPNVAGVTFGLNWSPLDGLSVVASGSCGDFEIASNGWPTEPLSGTAVTWNVNQSTGRAQGKQAIPVYWFAGAAYYGPTTVSIVANPSQGLNFADGSVPAILDAIPTGNLGTLGLNGATGTNPFGPVPTVESSWGQIKSIFGQ